jgi:hypothetical protein
MSPAPLHTASWLDRLFLVGLGMALALVMAVFRD